MVARRGNLWARQAALHFEFGKTVEITMPLCEALGRDGLALLELSVRESSEDFARQI
jgi:hypothetical protein